jgi:hypothetical protein
MHEKLNISEGGRIILNTVKDELFPLTEKLKNILVRVHSYRSTLLETNSKQLYEIESEYSRVSADFFVVTTKLQSSDLLFKDLPGEPQNIADYFQYQDAFQKNIDQGIGYIEIIDRTLDRKIQDIHNKVTLVISILAILISILLK